MGLGNALSDKRIVDTIRVMDVLQEHHEEFMTQVKSRGLVEGTKEYHAFAVSFASVHMGDEALTNEYMVQYISEYKITLS